MLNLPLCMANPHNSLLYPPPRPLHPAAQPQLKGRIAFPDSTRQMMAIALKSLGLSANTRPGQLLAAGSAGGGREAEAAAATAGRASRDVSSRGGSEADRRRHGGSGGGGGGGGGGSVVTAEAVRERFNALRAQALCFSNRDHVRALASGE